MNSKKLAGIIGPTLIAMNITEIMTSHIWVNVAATQTYLAGLLWFIAGLSIIRIHNKWTLSWIVLITLIGWFAILVGLSRMAFPETVQQGTEKSSFVLIGQVALLAIGAILSFKAFFQKDKKVNVQ